MKCTLAVVSCSGYLPVASAGLTTIIAGPSDEDLCEESYWNVATTDRWSYSLLMALQVFSHIISPTVKTKNYPPAPCPLPHPLWGDPGVGCLQSDKFYETKMLRRCLLVVIVSLSQSQPVMGCYCDLTNKSPEIITILFFPVGWTVLSANRYLPHNSDCDTSKFLSLCSLLWIKSWCPL